MPWIIAAIAAVIAAVAAALFLRSRRLPPTKRQMKQWARSPRFRRNISARFRASAELVARAEGLTDDEIRRGVEQVLAGDHEATRAWQEICGRIGPRMEPFLIDALRDPRARPPAEQAYLSPFARVTRLLGAAGSDAAVKALTPHLSSDQEDLRRHAAMYIAMVGSEAAAAPTARALQSDDKELRGGALSGAEDAAKRGDLAQAYRNAVFDALAPVVAGETSHNEVADWRAEAVFAAIGRERAIAHLASPRCLRPDNDHLSNVLAALNKAKAPLPAELLRALLEALESSSEHHATIARGRALAALARVDPRGAAAMYEAGLEDEDEYVRSGAVDALLAAHDLPEPYVLWGAEDAHGGFERLPLPVQHIIATVEFEAEVNNGGISQYFFNSAGDHWPTALEAFRAMGCPVCETILREATSVIRGGPSLDREKRIKQYGRLTDEQEKPLNELDSRFFDDEDHLKVQRARYMVQHADVIRQIAATMEARQ